MTGFEKSNLRRFVSLTVLTLAATSATSAFAGFQFSTPPAQQRPAPVAAAPQAYAPHDAPMPIVPAAPVESMALSPLPIEDVIAAQPAPQSPYPANNNGRLVINPYPLQQQGAVATHGVESGILSLDQAMMEQSNQLQPVVTPGSRSSAGMMARAEITSRHDRDAIVPPQKPMAQQMDYSASSMTPLPGNGAQNAYEMPAAAPRGIETQHLMPTPAIPMPRVPSPAGAFPEAVGFGRDLPLALALSQVVPADYSFSFAGNVDAGANVSWQGGKPWNDVLNEMLAPQGLRAAIAGSQVTIQRAI